jgi:hypothetical protein
VKPRNKHLRASHSTAAGLCQQAAATAVAPHLHCTSGILCSVPATEFRVLRSFYAVAFAHVAAGVTSADDVQVRCTISSVSVAVPDRYLLQLPLPFCIKDEAESVKYSSKTQPPTLVVILTEGSIPQQPAPQLPPAAAAPATNSAASQAWQSTRRRRGQQQQQQQQQRQPEAMRSSTSSGPSNNTALLAWGPIAGEKSNWLLPYALAQDWMDSSEPKQHLTACFGRCLHTARRQRMSGRISYG